MNEATPYPQAQPAYPAYPLQPTQQGWGQPGQVIGQVPPQVLSKEDPHTCFAWFTFLCCHPICGAFALAHSWDVERANQFGHQATAQAISQKAKSCACASLIFGLLFGILPTIVVIALAMTGVIDIRDITNY